MGSKWTRFSIGDIGTIVTGKTPKTTDETNFGADIPFITPRDLTGSRYITITERSLSKGGADTVRNSIIPEDTVVVSCIGSDMGKVAITTKPLNVTNQQINSIIVGNNFDAKFVYYNLSLRKLEIQQSAGGSAQPILNKTDFSNMDIWCPPLAEQRKIGKFISSFDDKIEINRQINQTLEQMAQTLFKSWFVDFDPVIDNALDAGNDIPDTLQERAEQRRLLRAKADFKPLSAETRALFPSEFEETELGWVPKGWSYSPLGHLIDFATGPAFKSNDFTESGVRLARGDNVKEGYFEWGDKTRYWGAITPALAKYTLQSGDILIGMDGSKVGKNWTRVEFMDLPCLLVQRVARLRPIDQLGSCILSILISSNSFKKYVDNVKTGTTIPHISGKQIKEFRVLNPNDNGVIYPTFRS